MCESRSRNAAGRPEGEPISTTDAQAFRALSDMFSKAGFQHSTGHWDNPQFDLLSDIAVSPATERVQLKAYHDAQRIMYAEVPGFPLYSPFWVNATRTSVSGYAPHPTEAEFWENIEIKQ